MRTHLVRAAALLAVLGGLAGLDGLASGATYYADAIHGDDASGDGSVAKPYRTLTRALSRASAAGDVVIALPGRYDPAIGESFPLLPRTQVSLLSLAGPQVTILDGQQTAYAVVELQDDDVLRGFTVTGSQHGWWNGGIYLTSLFGNNVTIDTCVITGNERGIWCFDEDRVSITSCFFTQNANDAISIFNSDHVLILNDSFDDNLKGIILDQSSGTIVNNVITHSGLSGIECSGGSVLVMDYNCLHANAKDYSSACVPGPHDVYLDPLYIDAARRDLHVSAVSPVLDQGDGANPDAPARDMDFQLHGNGAGFEMGADEIFPRYLYAMGFTALGEQLSIDLAAKPSDAWIMLMSLGSGHIDTDFGAFLLGFPFYVIASGTAPATGAVVLPGTFPSNPVFAGLKLHFQALSGDQLTNLWTMTIYG